MIPRAGGRLNESTQRSGMRILGVDPGSRTTGFAILEQAAGSKTLVLSSGTLAVPPRESIAPRLATLAFEMRRLIDQHRPHVAVVESLFRGVNPRSLIVLAQARGALLAAIAQTETPVYEYTPAEIKTAVTGNGRADKKMVARMVGMILGRVCDGRRGRDESDALAAAICFAQRYRMDCASGRIEDLRDALKKG